ncbi:predicted protein [Pyrenophora tritici-repentis Pt-1C-BFP]|uniref:Uncharacterized protein n=1 Tax=Pyrenophora tritici-repentis (strain Pt-1C-BFP) TaxID=426418 RepID=B2WB75_PYRTR|nr:uncharacterized protein PTRG_06887 [Pyrenophora tritici-repentis Pt-1C-BFP]EDU49807.1 predicted protein [Pyrenophora tritici-repentis Pt-1C-BFP]
MQFTQPKDEKLRPEWRCLREEAVGVFQSDSRKYREFPTDTVLQSVQDMCAEAQIPGRERSIPFVGIAQTPVVGDADVIANFESAKQKKIPWVRLDY